MRNQSRLVGLSASAITLMVLAGGCGGSEDNAEETKGDTSGSVVQDQGDSDEDSGESLPESFPDVPLPEGEIHSSTEVGDVGWRTMIIVDAEAEVEALKAEYTTLYEDAGFTVTQEGSVNMRAENDEWRIDMVVRAPIITVQVMEWGD